MKLTILASAMALCGGLALAQNPGTTTAKTDTKDHKLTAEFVSGDATAQQITVRKLAMSGTSAPAAADAPTFTLKLEGKALTRLSTVKAGDQVTISCKPLSAGGDMNAPITSQAQADLHCASVTDINKK